MSGAAHLAEIIAQDRAATPQLFTALRAAILRGELAPGLRLSEQEIAESMRVSRQPVREAFIRLSIEGLVEVRPQRGTFVTRISARQVIESRFVREAVEADLVRRAAEAADAALDRELEALVAAQEAALGAGPAVFMQLDEEFHRRIAEAAGQGGVWLHLQKLKAQMDRVRHLVAADMPRAALIRQHRAVVEAVKARNPDEAEAAMRRHLRQILSDLPAMAAAHPAFFVRDDNE